MPENWLINTAGPEIIDQGTPLLRNLLCRKEFMALGFIALGAFRGETAAAQRLEIDPDALTVKERPRPEYDPEPIRFGSFNASASVDTTVRYDSNLFAAADSVQSDLVLLAQPRIALQSNWRRNLLSFDLRSTVKQTLDHPTEDNIGYKATTLGRIDLGPATSFTTSVSYGKAFVQRGALQDANNVGRPIGFNEFSASGALETTLADLRLGANVAFADFKHLADSTNLPAVVNERNFRSLSFGGTAGYAVSSGIALIATGGYNRAVYPDSLINRDSDGYRVLGGIAFGASRLVRGQLSVGYLSQSYENPQFPKVSGVDVDAELTWSPYRTLTLSTRIDRSIQRSAIASVGGILDTVYSVHADYEFRRNIIARIGFEHERADYRGSPLRFRNSEGRAAAQWLISRRVTMNFVFNQSFTRSTDRLAGRFSRTQASVGLKLSL